MGLPCPKCGDPVLAGSRFCSACGAAVDGVERGLGDLQSTRPYQPPAAPPVSPAPSSTPDPNIRFTPGQVLAGRYRIVSRIGKGGMGEVYRADDLRLGQAVALKFLPAGLANDPQRLAYFHEEVRLARQVSHPNVCRVYDIAEWRADGREAPEYFLSMEFIDGEDLASLLKRIGRLPMDKGVQFAQQLCAGLAAAHEKGVVHRDLKPANLMLDGRGHVRLIDLGLARVAEKLEGADARSGTPGYMAPEQLAGREATARTDIYALGLVLYEVFTGKRPFKASSVEELRHLLDESTPPSPASHVSDLDPAIERVIMRCLEREPRDRPASAHAVAAALPGGDPLAAALAAGETPSPEMVAAAGEKHGLHPAVAAAWLAVVVVGLAINAIAMAQLSIVNWAPPELPPEALAVRAREILRGLGYPERPVSSAFSLELNYKYVNYLREQTSNPNHIELLGQFDPPAVSFWYRQSPKVLFVDNFFARGAFKGNLMSRTTVTPEIPAWDEPGMAGVELNLRGKLRWFRAIPPRWEEAAKPGTEPPWSQWFSEEVVGFRLDELELASQSSTPFDAYHQRRAWKIIFPGQATVMHVEAAAYAGKPVYFAVRGPWEEAPPAGPPEAALSFITVLGLLLKLGAAILVVRNWRLQRADRRGGFRFACYVFGLYMTIWLLEASHVLHHAEIHMFDVGVAQALYQAAVAWLYYMALEPYVRRLWPQTLTTSGRVLEGRLRDPVVGRDLLLGTAAAMTFTLLVFVATQLPSWLGWEPSPPVNVDPGILRSPRSMLSLFFVAQIAAVQSTLLVALFLFFLRLLFRRQWLANTAFVAVFAALISTSTPYPLVSLAPAMACLVIVAWLVTRFGLLATTAFFFAGMLFSWLPVTFEPLWYRDYGLLGLAVILAVAGYGFWTSLGGRPMFGEGGLATR